MKRVLRIFAAAVLAIGGLVGVASTATAEDQPLGCESEDGYFPSGICQVTVEADAVCEANIPYLDYAAILEGTSTDTVTVTFSNPTGDDVVMSGQPLSGRIVWPGTVLDSDGKAVDYPGWTKNADGTWAKGDAYSWAASDVDVTFTANPAATVTVAYPAESSACVPVSKASSDLLASGVLGVSLSSTGFSGAPLIGAAGGLLAGGALLLVLSRRRRSSES